MSNKTQQNQNSVQEYLVERIKKLEKENQELQAALTKALVNQSKWFNVKGCFSVEGNAIVVRDFKKQYVGMFAIECQDGYKEILSALDLDTRHKELLSTLGLDKGE